VAGYDEQLREKEEVVERISKNYVNEMYRGKRRIGLPKMVGGKFVERVPSGEIPEIEFWTEDEWTSAMERGKLSRCPKENSSSGDS
jgi:hypothetical protein